jgi:hypothetical protein
MIKATKAFFLSRVLREKLLLLAFILLVAGVWLSSFGGRAASFWRDEKILKTTLATQKLSLDSRDAVAASAQHAIAQLDPARTLNDTRLLGEINAIANTIGLRSNSISTNEARTERTAQFAINTLHVQVNKASYATLVKFYLELQKRSPYIGLDEFSMLSDPGSRGADVLNASLRVSSVEVIR